MGQRPVIGSSVFTKTSGHFDFVTDKIDNLRIMTNSFNGSLFAADDDAGPPTMTRQRRLDSLIALPLLPSKTTYPLHYTPIAATEIAIET